MLLLKKLSASLGRLRLRGTQPTVLLQKPSHFCLNLCDRVFYVSHYDTFLHSKKQCKITNFSETEQLFSPSTQKRPLFYDIAE